MVDKGAEMRNYILKRLLLIPLTLLGILAINFVIIQFAPGGPVEHTLAKYRGINVNATGAISGGAGMNAASAAGKYQGAQGVPEDLLKSLKNNSALTNRHYRFFKVSDYARFDFGKSFYQDKTVWQLIKERMPVSVSLGLWSTLIIYLIAFRWE